MSYHQFSVPNIHWHVQPRTFTNILFLILLSFFHIFINNCSIFSSYMPIKSYLQVFPSKLWPKTWTYLISIYFLSQSPYVGKILEKFSWNLSILTDIKNKLNRKNMFLYTYIKLGWWWERKLCIFPVCSLGALQSPNLCKTAASIFKNFQLIYILSIHKVPKWKALALTTCQSYQWTL